MLELIKEPTLLGYPALARGQELRVPWVVALVSLLFLGFLRSTRKMSTESSKASSRHEMGLDELLRKMKLREAEHEEVALAREEKESLPAVKWMAVGKLLTLMQYSELSLFAMMKVFV